MGIVTGVVHAFWFNPAANSMVGEWISPPMDTDTSSPFTYTSNANILVDTSVVDPASIRIDGQVAADNFWDALVIRPSGQTGVSHAAGSFGAGYGGLTPFSFTSGLGFQPGSNSVAFQVRNEGTQQIPLDPMGLYATFALTATCRVALPPAPVPVDASWALAGLSALLAGLGALRQRRRKAG